VNDSDELKDLLDENDSEPLNEIDELKDRLGLK
jgi:hypothetical protein